MSQRGIRKRPFEQAKPNFDSESSSEEEPNIKRKKTDDVVSKGNSSPGKATKAKKKPRNFV